MSPFEVVELVSGWNDDAGEGWVEPGRTHLCVVIGVHDTREEAVPKVVYHILDGSLLSVPCCHDAVLSGGDAGAHRLPSIQLKLHHTESAAARALHLMKWIEGRPHKAACLPTSQGPQGHA